MSSRPPQNSLQPLRPHPPLASSPPKKRVVFAPDDNTGRPPPPPPHGRSVRDPKIPIGPAQPNRASSFPRFPPYEAFGRRPRAQSQRACKGPPSETLDGDGANNGHTQKRVQRGLDRHRAALEEVVSNSDFNSRRPRGNTWKLTGICLARLYCMIGRCGFAAPHANCIEAERWPKSENLRRSWPPTWSDSVDLPARTRTELLRGCAALRSDLIDPTIAVHHGRVIKRTGDGALVEFRSVVDAVRCAVEMQNAMVERNAGVPNDRQIEFRIGIHLGDVVEESDGDLMGDGVNIAARLEGIAQPGAICLSEDAYRQVRARLDLEVNDLGATQLKNIVEPVRVYSLQVGLPAQPKPAASTTLTPPEKPAERLALARQAFDRGPAVPEHERRPGAGIFRRRHGRRHHHRAVADQMAVRDRAQFELRLQGQGRGYQAGRARARRALCFGGGCAQGGQPIAHHRPAHRSRDRGSSVGRQIRRRAGGCFRPTGPDHRESGWHRRAEPAAVGDRTRAGASVPKISTPTTSICAPFPTWRLRCPQTRGSQRGFWRTRSGWTRTTPPPMRSSPIAMRYSSRAPGSARPTKPPGSGTRAP